MADLAKGRNGAGADTEVLSEVAASIGHGPGVADGCDAVAATVRAARAVKPALSHEPGKGGLLARIAFE